MNKQNCDTGDLIKLLRHGSLDDVIYCIGPQPTFPAFLAQFCAERNITREQVIQRGH